MIGKIGKHRCPRCKSQLWFNSDDAFKESIKKPYLYCPVCYVPYKITLHEKKRRVVAVKKLEQQVEIPITVKQPNGGESIIYEKSISDNDFESLKKAIEVIKNMMKFYKLTALRDALPSFGYYYGIVDFETGMEYGTYAPLPSSSDVLSNIVERAGYYAFVTIYNLYHRYPFQVRQLICRYGIESVLKYMSTVCPQCQMVIPLEMAMCPYCKFWLQVDTSLQGK
ncbi:MAG: hypothetical protein QXF82_04635 [Nitrososphaeria archaeon]